MVFKTHSPGKFMNFSATSTGQLPGVANNVASVDPKELWNNSSDTASGLWRDFVFLDSEKKFHDDRKFWERFLVFFGRVRTFCCGLGG